ncbi:hypothetical protein B0T21DRAFT_355051 [Apiosordaria backusii]|uniref:Uncharacterized protein n=1 Tax=Apiosordaria backusii TaxID=314023 RepID=A0AA40EYA2_9PEZI|nr:hypothetical protein B0T21DRAFT_355051 [Apiosordaria backusii]
MRDPRAHVMLAFCHLFRHLVFPFRLRYDYSHTSGRPGVCPLPYLKLNLGLTSRRL